MTEPIQRELTDQQMALRLIERMDKRCTLHTIIVRLEHVESAIQMAGLMVNDHLITEDQAIEWIVKTLEAWARG